LISEPSHFENPLLEQRRLLAGTAVIEWHTRSPVSVSGVNAKSWLHPLLSQNIVNLEPGQSTEALLLDPKGHIEQQLAVIVTSDEAVLLVVDQDHRADLVAWLRRMVFRSAVEIADLSESHRVVGAFTEIQELQDLPCFVDSWPNPRPGGVKYGGWAEPFGYREYVVPVTTEIPSRLTRAGLLAFDGLRIWAGRPWTGDYDDRALPHEFDLLSTAVHLSKGCYRGQETVAKVHNLGHPPRRLVLLELDSSESLPAPDDKVHEVDSGREVGRVLVAAQHHEAGPIALALVSRVTVLEKPLAVSGPGGSYQATQQLLVPPTAGAANPRPKLPKLHLGAKK